MKSLGFKGGVHPAEQKDLTDHKKPVVMDPPDTVVVHVAQHIGAPAVPSVAKRDEVLKGQVIAEPGGFVSVPIHSPVSGKVVKIDAAPHVLGGTRTAITIKNDGEDNWIEHEQNANWENSDPKELIEKIQSAGVVGMGGATFPTHVKLSPPPSKPIDTIILNGAECEPYLTADHQLMLLHPLEIIGGLRIFMKILGQKTGYVAIEDNKPDAIAAIRKACDRFDGIEVVPMHVKYPQGAEKQLIKALTSREVPCAGLPMDVGCVVQNVATAVATYRAIAYNEPLIERYCTVTGDAIAEPKNLKISVGTPIDQILDFCGGLLPDAHKVIAGGPMMGMGLGHLETPAMKGTGGLLCLSEKYSYERVEQACLRCGTCVTNCPMGLAPTTIAMYAKNELDGQAEVTGAMDCIECGCCSFGCPSTIPLVQYIRIAKNRIAQAKRAAAGK